MSSFIHLHLSQARKACWMISSAICLLIATILASENGYCAAYSFGELFNSRLGDQIIIATVKDGKPLLPADGFAMSVTGEDSTGGRSVKRIKIIEVQ
jgi:hypothetical protein